MISAVLQYFSFYNNFDTEGMISFLHEDIGYKRMSQGKLVESKFGIPEIKQMEYNLSKLYKKREKIIEEIKFVDDWVVVHSNSCYIFADNVSDKSIRGKLVSIKVQSIFHFKDDKIVLIEDIS
jgi:F420-dependent methylenetetrahydromethanopterin dehydrogenase